MASIPVIIANSTPNQLVVSGSKGSDLTQLAAVGTPLNPGTSLLVAYFTLPGSYGDNYEWIYFTDNSNSGSQYQIYMEYNSFGPGLDPNLYAFMGYKNANSEQGSANPSPFPEVSSTSVYFAYGDGVNGTGNVASAVTYVFNSAPPGLSSLLISPSTLTANQTASGTVVLSSASGAGGAVISLSSSNPEDLAVPASVTINQGEKAATFTVSAGSVSEDTQVTVTSTFYGGTETATVTVAAT